MKIAIFGGDGFCGWPASLFLSDQGHEVAIVDNLSRRAIDAELGAESLTPIASIEERLAAWKEVSGKDISFANIDIAKDYAGFVEFLRSGCRRAFRGAARRALLHEKSHHQALHGG